MIFGAMRWSYSCLKKVALICIEFKIAMNVCVTITNEMSNYEWKVPTSAKNKSDLLTRKSKENTCLLRVTISEIITITKFKNLCEQIKSVSNTWYLLLVNRGNHIKQKAPSRYTTFQVAWKPVHIMKNRFLFFLHLHKNTHEQKLVKFGTYTVYNDLYVG